MANLKSDVPSRTVLVVEDTEDNRFMLRRLLEMSGYTVIEARNGEEAVQMARDAEPALILMDLSLPVIDGLAVSAAVRDCVRAVRKVTLKTWLPASALVKV